MVWGVFKNMIKIIYFLLKIYVDVFFFNKFYLFLKKINKILIIDFFNVK